MLTSTRAVALLGAVGCCAAVWFYPVASASGDSEETVTVRVGTVSQRVMIGGNLWPRRRASVWPHTAGRVTKVSATRSARVQQGDVLFHLDDAAARSELERVSLLLQKAQLAFNNPSSDTNSRVTQIDVKLAEREVAEARKRVETAIVRAPIDGVVLHVGVSEGDFVNVGNSSGSPPVIIGGTDEYVVEAEADDYEAIQLTSGLNALVFIDGANIPPLSGKVRDQPMLKRFSTGPSMPSLFAVRITLLEPPPSRYIGLTCRVEIEIARHTDVPILLLDAVRTSGVDSYVMVKSRGSAQRQPVTLGLSDSGVVELLTGPPVGSLILRPSAAGAASSRTR